MTKNQYASIEELIWTVFFFLAVLILGNDSWLAWAMLAGGVVSGVKYIFHYTRVIKERQGETQ